MSVSTGRVWIVEYADCDGGIVLVASSLESAVAELKDEYKSPYKVRWEALRQSDDGEARISASFQAIPGLSTAHTASFFIRRYPVCSSAPEAEL